MFLCVSQIWRHDTFTPPQHDLYCTDLALAPTDLRLSSSSPENYQFTHKKTFNKLRTRLILLSSCSFVNRCVLFHRAMEPLSCALPSRYTISTVESWKSRWQKTGWMWLDVYSFRGATRGKWEDDEEWTLWNIAIHETTRLMCGFKSQNCFFGYFLPSDFWMAITLSRTACCRYAMQLLTGWWWWWWFNKKAPAVERQVYLPTSFSKNWLHQPVKQQSSVLSAVLFVWLVLHSSRLGSRGIQNASWCDEKC